MSKGTGHAGNFEVTILSKGEEGYVLLSLIVNHATPYGS